MIPCPNFPRTATPRTCGLTTLSFTQSSSSGPRVHVTALARPARRYGHSLLALSRTPSMTRYWSLAVAVILAASTSAVGAQRKTLITATGIIYHYHGDTIWSERDTSETRVIFRGDTIVRRSSIDGREIFEMTLLVVGDSAKTLSSSRAGSPATQPFGGTRAMPRTIATAERDMLGTALELERLRALAVEVNAKIRRPSCCSVRTRPAV